MENKFETITNILRNAADAVDVEIATEPKMKKTDNPYLGRVKKHTAYIGVDFGANYTEEVNKRRLEEGKAADFQAKKSPYEYVNEYFVRKGDQLYLQILMQKDVKVKSLYEVDERPATEEEVKEIGTFMYSHGKATNQGLNDENVVEMRVVKIENIVAVGGHTWAKDACGEY